ncbi:hypothetical protein [Streptomyces olivaceoviridis]|uniref:hypothetical protein n=1 Tax=Streptomyces olivaceoviridis TaxID=1921 RepID=UPI001678F5AC|nr:hypothetical protein [Streptomyces olivaceoviridis]
MSSDTALRAQAPGKRFGFRGGWALCGCSFRLPAGRVCAVVGPSGAGTSTLLALAAVPTTLAFWLVHRRTTGAPTHPKATRAAGAGREGAGGRLLSPRRPGHPPHPAEAAPLPVAGPAGARS